MPGTPGALTTDDVPLLLLYNEFRDSVERHNEMDRNFKTLLCRAATTKRTATIRTRSMRFQESGEDTTQPDYQHVGRHDIDLEAPRRWVIGTGITARAYEDGISSDEVREHNAEILDADDRLLQEVVVRRSLWNTAGGWYNGTIMPPYFKMNRFVAAHTHYLAANVAGVPLLAHFTAMKQHITEHGYTQNLVAFTHTTQATNIINNTEWAAAVGAGPMNTPVMARLQELGFGAPFMAAGVPVYAEDWIPEDYILMVSLDVKPMDWRVPEGGDNGNRNVKDLMLFDVAAGDESLMVKYLFIEEAVRRTSATVTAQGAGVVTYLGGANYVNPTTFYV